MALKIGKREKIVAFGITGIVGILLVHIFIFSGKTKRFQEAEYRLQEKSAMLQSLRQPLGLNQLAQYKEQTEKFRVEFRKVVEKFEIYVPEFWQVTDLTPEVREQQWGDLYSLLDQLRALREQGKANDRTTLAFMGTGYFRWNFPEGVPTQVASGRRNLYDLLTQLLGAYKAVQASKDSTPQFRASQVHNYALTLSLLDINYNFWATTTRNPDPNQVPALFETYQLCGPTIPYLKLVEHVRIFLKNKPEDIKGELASREKLMEIVGLNPLTGTFDAPIVPDFLYPSTLPSGAQGGHRSTVTISLPIEPFVYFSLYRQQLAALIDIVKRADAAGVTSIEFVKLRDLKIIDEATKNPFANAGTGQPGDPTVAPAAAEEGGDIFFSPTPAPLFGAAPAVATGPAAAATPIEMMCVGSNQAISNFLFDLTHCHRPYELDALKISGQLNQGGQATLTVSVTINVLAQIVGIEKKF